MIRRGLNVVSLPDNHHCPQPFPGGRIRTVTCTHGRGLVGRFMAHGVGYFIEIEGEPSLYLCGDTLLTDQIRQFVALHQPEVSVVPASGACLDIGSEIIMGVEEVIEFTQSVRGRLIARLLMPADGEAVDVRLATNSEQARG